MNARFQIAPTGYWHGAEDYGHKHSPALAQWLCEKLPRELPVNDFGCGDAAYLRALAPSGFDVRGYEWALFTEPYVVKADITRPIYDSRRRGSALCLEVAEHIPVQHEGDLLSNLVRALHPYDGLLVMSWALPGQGGDGHVNERPLSYSIPRMTHYGLECDAALSREVRKLDHGPCWWFNDTLMVFRSR